MITEAELTGSGIKAMTETGGFTLSFAYEAGRCSILITNAGAAPIEVPLSLDATHHLSEVAARARRAALLDHPGVPADRLVPRRASKA